MGVLGGDPCRSSAALGGRSERRRASLLLPATGTPTRRAGPCPVPAKGAGIPHVPGGTLGHGKAFAAGPCPEPPETPQHPRCHLWCRYTSPGSSVSDCGVFSRPTAAARAGREVQTPHGRREASPTGDPPAAKLPPDSEWEAERSGLTPEKHRWPRLGASGPVKPGRAAARVGRGLRKVRRTGAPALPRAPGAPAWPGPAAPGPGSPASLLAFVSPAFIECRFCERSVTDGPGAR